MKQQIQTNKIEWKEVELGDICEEIAGGGTPSRLNKEYFGGNIPWVVVKDIVPEIKETSEYLTEEGLKNSSSKLWPAGTIILSTGATIGKVGIASIKLCTKQGVTGLVPKKFVFNKFLYFYLTSITKELEEGSRGITIKEIYKSSLRKIKIRLPFSNSTPNLKEQERIVSILEKAEKLKERGKNVGDLLDKYLKSVFNEMFLRDKKKFEIKKLGEICDVRDGTHNSPKYVKEGYPLITSKNLTNGFIDFSEINLISKADFDEVNKRSGVDSGDIIMPMIGTIGHPVIIPNNIQEFAIKNVALIKFKNSTVLNIYIKFILDSPYFDQVTLKNNRGGTQKFIALGDIRNIPIPLPPLPLQQKFAKIVEQVEKMKENVKKTKQNSDELFNSLMQKAFRGSCEDVIK